MSDTILSANAMQVLKQRYLRQSSNGTPQETPAGMFNRVAYSVAKAESLYGGSELVDLWSSRFYQSMIDLDFLPNSPTLMNAGFPRAQMSACFVLPLDDNLESIYQTLKDAALIHQSGGGTGYNFSALRPKNDAVLTTGGTSSGPVSFIRLFDASTEFVKMGGRRRGANMGILDIDHPDILDFIRAKSSPNSLPNFNLSLWITDSFMTAVQLGEPWPLINPRTKKTDSEIPARKLWDMIVSQAWSTGDPGLLFDNHINEKNPTPSLGTFRCTNPCGELPLYEYESCNLGSINLGRMTKPESDGLTIDWEHLDQTIETGIRFLDNVIDINHYIKPEIKERTRFTRKIGLGVMGWSDLLLQLEIPYASEEAVRLAEKLMKHIDLRSLEVSENLAVERGSFEAWDQSIYHPGRPVRNATRTSIAPTGTISIIANTTSSIEPLFAVVYKRKNILGGQEQTEVNPIFRKMAEARGIWNEELAHRIFSEGSLQNISGVPRSLRRLFLCSHDIDWKWHVRHQLAFQKFTDNAVSKTINLPKSATVRDVHDAFIYAWKNSAKGITVYRDRSKADQFLQTGTNHRVICC